MWANLHLLFWLSLVPFVTGWMGENHYDAAADRGLRRRAADGGDRLHHPADDADLAARPQRGAGPRHRAATSRASCRCCSTSSAIPLAFVATWASIALYVVVALMWLVPDRRIERVLAEHHEATVGGGSHH